MGLKYEIQPHIIPVAAYIAGMIDADGHISMRGEHRMELVVTNTYKPLMNWLSRHTGVTNGVYRKGYLCTNECAKRHVHARKPIYRWVARGHRAYIIGRGIRPYLLEKRVRLEDVLLLESDQNKKAWIQRTRREMLELGWLTDDS